MSRYDEPPEHWNSYRPSYRPRGPSSHAYPPYTNSRSASPTRSPTPPSSTRLWSSDLSDLMSRTCRAYDLVINYANDCPLGTRWSLPDIERVRGTGKRLHEDVRLVKYWRGKVEKLGYGGESMMSKIRRDVEIAWEQCNAVQGVIEETENMPRANAGQKDGGKGYKDVEMRDEKYQDDDGSQVSYDEREYNVRGADRDLDTHYSSLPIRGRGNTTIDTYRPGRESPIGRMGKHAVYR